MKALVYLLTVPLLGQQGVSLYSVEKERAVGAQYASEVRRQSEPPGDPSVREYADRIGRQLLSGLADRRWAYQFEVISGGDRVDPFALPGGYVFIPAATFISTHSEDEFAGALAHAIGHAALRHGTRTASRGQVTDLTGTPLVFMGWTGSHADSASSQLLVPLSFLEVQRTYELEADRFGLELTSRSGYDASAFLRILSSEHTRRTRSTRRCPTRSADRQNTRDARLSARGYTRRFR